MIGAGVRQAARWTLSHERKQVRKIAGWVLSLAIVGGIIGQLHAIGWADIWRARPREPAFYALVGLSYLVLPVFDVLIFRRLWGIAFWSSLGAFLRKRVLNSAFIGYSGEIFLLIWARDRLAIGDTRLAHDIKDSNILSAVVSTLVTAALILHFLADGAWRHFGSGSIQVWAVVTLAITALLPLALLFRGKLMLLGTRDSASVLALHSVRFAIGQVLTLLQWHVALGVAGWGTLVQLLTVQLLVNRIPLIPNRDLLFIGVGIAVCGRLTLDPAQVASLLVISNALQLVLHLGVMIATSAAPGKWQVQP